MTSEGQDQNLSDEEKDNAAWLDENAWMFSDEPVTLLYGAGGSGKIITPTEDYDKLAKSLTGDAPVKGVGRALRGDEAAAYGRAMLEKSVGGPEKLAELVEKLKTYRNN